LIQAENISKTFILKNKKHFWSRGKSERKEAVKNVTMQVKPGKIIGLLGINGAGKTTTIKMLTTMISPTSGSILVDGIDAVQDPFAVKKVINLITGGERNIYWRLTARENLDYFGSLYAIPQNELKKQIDHCLEIVQLTDKSDIPVEKFSKGMKQRLQIARGLINNPKYIFLDEPTLGLDVIIAKELRSYIKKLAVEQNKGILLTTHYITEADELCDYIYLIDQGETVAQGTPSEIKKHYAATYKTSFYFDCYDQKLFDELKNQDGVLSVKENKEQSEIVIISKNEMMELVLNVATQYHRKLTQAVTSEPSLEDSLIEAIKGGKWRA